MSFCLEDAVTPLEQVAETSLFARTASAGLSESIELPNWKLKFVQEELELTMQVPIISTVQNNETGPMNSSLDCSMEIEIELPVSETAPISATFMDDTQIPSLGASDQVWSLSSCSFFSLACARLGKTNASHSPSLNFCVPSAKSAIQGVNPDPHA